MKILITTILLAFLHVTVSAQARFLGLTAGKSSRTEVEAVLGVPKTKASDTLIEYNIPDGLKNREMPLKKVYVQYNPQTDVAERIEILCLKDLEHCFDKGVVTYRSGREHHIYSVYDGSVMKTQDGGDGTATFTKLQYFGGPDYFVRTTISKSFATGSNEERIGLYSPALYDAAVPKEGCIGAFVGQWETNRGLLNATRPRMGNSITGTFSMNDGTFTATQTVGQITGEWKDATGSGTFNLRLVIGKKDQVKGTWNRTTGPGPKTGIWEGRCLGK